MKLSLFRPKGRTLTTILALGLLSTLVFSFDRTVSWEPPVLWENGDPLLEQDLDFYTLYCNGQPFITIDNIIGQRTAVVDFAPLGEGTHVCHLTVTALNGMESGPSNTSNFTVGPRIPGAPQNFVITL